MSEDEVRFRVRPEDFLVTELALFLPSGEGEHVYLWLEKRGCGTEWVARELARAFGLEQADVGYAGRKDRHAVTRQWFSLRGVDLARARQFELEGVRVLEAVRHRHKLRTGALLGNRFEVRLHGVTAELAERAADRLLAFEQRGCPNRFGRQRFGRDGDNARRGAELLAGRAWSRDRRGARFLVSALQSAVFNRVLELRAAALDELRVGELAMVHAPLAAAGSDLPRGGGVFRVTDPAAEAPRLRAFEISPTGPIFGTKMMSPQGEALAEETRALEELGIPPAGALQPPRGFSVPGARRALRVRPERALIERVESGGGELVVRFELPAGSYATVLLEELLPGVRLIDAAGESEAD